MIMKTSVLTLLLSLAVLTKLFSQNVAINSTGSNPDASAMLDISSTTKGFLAPRMTSTERDAITSPATGLTIFNTTIVAYQVNTGTPISPVWSTLGSGNGTVSSVSVTSANGVSGTVATSTTTPAISLTLGAITPSSVAASGTVSGSNLSGTNTGDQTITLTGNVTGSGTGSFATTIANNAVTYAKMQAVSTTSKLLGSSSTTTPVQEITLGSGLNLTGTTLTATGSGGTVTSVSALTLGTAGTNLSSTVATGTTTPVITLNVPTASASNRGALSSTDWSTFNSKQSALSGTGYSKWSGTTPSYLTSTQVTADLNLFTSALQGLVPSSGGGATNFLRADGTWAAPSTNAWNITGNSGTTSANFLGTTSNASLRFRTNNVETMIIDSTGNVGIGTSDFDDIQPEKLLVDAGTYPNNGSTINSTPINAIGASNGFQQIQVQNRSWGNYASSDLIAASDGTENGSQPVNTKAHYVDLGINSSGYTNNNSNILNQPYTAYLYSTTPYHFFIGNGYQGKDIIFFTNYGNTNSNNTADGFEIMRLKGGTSVATQQVTIGTPTPNGTNKLTVSGSISASAFNVSSDRRLKTNIAELHYGLDAIMALQPVSYNWKETPATDKQIGLIAQDTKKTIPEIVSGSEDTGKLSINYTELIPVLINAIKEQQQQIDTLRKDLEELKNKK
jgi:hypothetical protein